MPSKKLQELRKASMPVADILRYAADERLRHPFMGHYVNGRLRETYSCLAVSEALKDKLRPDIFGYTAMKQTKQGRVVYKFLKDLGVDVGSCELFTDVDTETAQEIRYAWLHFAANVAEEEGLMC
jgi:hypothetical protein